jgi:hypothetical protein
MNQLMVKSHSVVISLVLPNKFKNLTSYVNDFNRLVESKYGRTDGIYICRHNNFYNSDGLVNSKLLQNAFRPSYEGIRVLAGKLRHTLIPNPQRQISGHTYSRQENLSEAHNFNGQYGNRSFMSHSYRGGRPPLVRDIKRDRPDFDVQNLAKNIASTIAKAFQ